MNRILPILLIFFAHVVCAQIATTLPAGFSAAGQGSLISGPAGRDPFAPLSLSADTTSLSFQCAYVNYCSVFQSGAPGDVRRILAGCRIHHASTTGSVAVSLFDAFSMWREGMVRVSLGRENNGWKVSAGCDATVLGIAGNPDQRDFSCEGDLSMAHHGRRGLLCAAGRFPLSDDGVDGPSRMARSRASIIFALRESVIGAPGIRFEVADFERPRFAVIIGESIALGEHFAVSASIRTHPATIGIGCVFAGSSVSTALSGLRVPQLGFSGGVAAEYHLHHSSGKAAAVVAP